MRHQPQQQRLQRCGAERRGVVAVEFAIVAPILVAIVFGLIELGRAFEMQNLLEVAAREGARFASMDRDGLLDPGESATDKLIEDVKTFLDSNGIAGRRRAGGNQGPRESGPGLRPRRSGQRFEAV